MRAPLVLAAVALSGCVNAANFNPYAPNSATIAHSYVGLNERNDRAQLRELVGVDPVRTEWCAAFVNSILDLQGIPGSNSVSDHPLMARSFLQWGSRVEKSDIRPGDVVVFPRGGVSWQGHVGFYVATADDGRWIILGGNQDNTVSYAYFSPRYALAVRRHTDSVVLVSN